MMRLKFRKNRFKIPKEFDEGKIYISKEKIKQGLNVIRYYYILNLSFHLFEDLSCFSFRDDKFVLRSLV